MAEGRTSRRRTGFSHFLDKVPAQVRSELERSGSVIDCPAGAVLFKSDLPPHVGIVLAGTFRRYVLALDGRQYTLGYAGKGDLVGSLWLVGLGMESATQAIDPSSMLQFDSERFERLIIAEPAFGRIVIEDLRERLRVAYWSLGVCVFGSMRQRVANDLLRRMAVAESLEDGARLRVSNQELADAVGSVKDVVGRAVRQLRSNGIINLDHGYCVILDAERLRREARSLYLDN